jgi:hypothetical protein
MGLNVAYSYCCNLTDEKKVEIDKQVIKNQIDFILAISFFALPFGLNSSSTIPRLDSSSIERVEYIPPEVFTPSGFIRKKEQQLDSAISLIDRKIDEKIYETACKASDFLEDCAETYIYIYNKVKM